MKSLAEPLRNLVVVLGDQLDPDSAAFDGFDPKRDGVWMAEAAGESTRVWSHKARIVLFLAAMRHFRDALRERGWKVSYTALDDLANCGSLSGELVRACARISPEKLVMTEPGDWRVEQALKKAAKDLRLELEIRTDRHFFSTKADFATHCQGRKVLRMEFFYREIRRATGVLMESDEPLGGKWNFDADNRESFSAEGPGLSAKPVSFAPDAATREVMDLVERKFPDHPGDLKHFSWPVTSEQAAAALEDFIANRLPDFGRYQDAMWTGEPFLNHSLISSSLNLKLLNPRNAVAAAEQAYRKGRAPLAAVEGFVRQILGWREFVRGIYWRLMPGYVEMNILKAETALPAFYWTGKTVMNCLRHVVGQTLERGYAHHIQRLMVTGLFAMLLGVRPKEIHEWHLAVYVDAVEWVELPNTLGMSQHADGGLMASKPYAATGKYIQRMSNYCDGCRFKPEKSTGQDACPFTTLYWDFLLRNEPFLRKNQRMAMQLKNLVRLTAEKRADIRKQAEEVRGTF